MLVPFVIDADSLAPDPSWTSSQLRSCHHDLLDIWRRMGLLVHDGDSLKGSRLMAAVQKLPQNLRLRWLAALDHGPYVSCGNGWVGAVELTSTREISSSASLALVDDTRAEVEFGFGEDEDERTLTQGDSRLGICRVLAANRASGFSMARELAERHIVAGERYQDIWESRFKSLVAAPLKHVAIVDRYAVEQHFRCQQHSLSGLERFLRLLGADASGPRYVNLYSAWTADLTSKTATDVETELKQVLSRIESNRINRLTVFMLPNRAFGEEARDRFVRFDRFVWDLGHGLEVFEGPAARVGSSASFKSNAESYLVIERELAKHPDARRAIRIRV